ncbi:hypothetical protein [Sphingomonas psychrotolerans]|nr:hypothetical protein [Sphingomonas psychrotolerans]
MRPILLRLAPALLALAATLLLGTTGLPFAERWRWFESAALLPVIGIAFAAAAGLLACHLALLSITPRPSLFASALPAALIAGALPGLGSAALLVPLAIAAPAALRRPAGAAALGGVAIALAAAWLHSPALHLAGALAMLAAATLEIRRAARPAANDNTRNEAFTAFWSLPEDAGCARQPARTSSPVLGE